MPSGGKNDATHAPGRGEELDKVCVQGTANLSPPGFFLGKVRTGHLRWMNVLVRVLFISQKNIVAVGKRRSHDDKRTMNNTIRVHNDQHRGACTPHSTLYSCQETRSLHTSVYSSAFRRVRLTHSAVVSKACVKKMSGT